jgi:tetratricopeptide (TPR) repeat protein
MLPRPQPLGLFPFPAGQLLLPPVPLDDSALAERALGALLRGAEPDEWPAAWSPFALALGGHLAAALELTRGDHSPVGAYNTFVLGGDADALARARDSGNATVRTLIELAAYVQGAREEPPAPDAVDHELRANVHLAHAAAALERQDPASAALALQAAVRDAEPMSPVLAAQALAQHASLTDSPAEAEGCWRRALELAGDAPLPGLRGELLYGLAIAVHQQADTNRARLIDAVQLYQTALQGPLTREAQPELWAQAQANLGLVYVSMPMSDAGGKLRHAVAIQAFREALTVFQRETHPEAWASTMLNMANAMQYLPSSHPRENLVDAVTAYEELLSVRTRAMDPVGYARILANQGNALAHLGIFQPAVEKLTEAHKLLHWYNEADAASQLLQQLEDINVQLATSGAG